MKEEKIDISIVLACYNEMGHLNQSMQELTEFLATTKLRYELILIDDCSTDGTAEEIAKFSKKYMDMRRYGHSINIGRGGTVSEGLMKAKGRVIGFIDIDLEISPVYILPCYFYIKQGYDVVTANRIYKVKISSIDRWILSRGYNYLVRKLLDIPFLDTEAGFKFFNREKLIPILKEINNKKWFWDTEVMVRSYLKCYKIKEIPVLYVRNNNKISTVHIFRDSKDYFIDLVKFRKEVKKLRG